MLIRAGADKTHFAQTLQPNDGRVQLGSLWSNTASNELYICIQVTPSIQFQLLTGGSGAPTGAPYVTFGADGTLSNERVLTAGANITIDTATPGQIIISGAEGGGASNLDGLTDVVISSPASAQVLRYNGTNWVNATLPAIAAADLPTAIDAAKIANGTVSNAQFQRLSGVTSAIQTQLDGKAATSHNHTKANVTDLETITATPTASAVPKADGSNKLANGWLKTGSGNGLDADTVDGQHAADFISTAQANTFAALQTFGVGARLSNNQALSGRNAANGADLALVKLDAADQLILGAATIPTIFRAARTRPENLQDDDVWFEIEGTSPDMYLTWYVQVASIPQPVARIRI